MLAARQKTKENKLKAENKASMLHSAEGHGVITKQGCSDRAAVQTGKSKHAFSTKKRRNPERMTCITKTVQQYEAE